MKRFAICAILVAGAAVVAAPVRLRAQVVTGTPIILKAPKPKKAAFKGEVINATAIAITVRSRENERLIRTFTYSDRVREKMQALIDHGGYQYGDKVVIHYEAGSDIALRIKGKPSKPR